MKKTLFQKIFILIFIFALIASVCIACSDIEVDSQNKTITFKVKNDEGDWIRYSGIRTKGEEILTFPNEPQKEGYVFDGWYSDSFYNTEVKEYSYQNTKITENIILYARFIENSQIQENYTVTFVTYGANEIENLNLKYRSLVKVDKPVKIDSTFLGWYLDEEFTIKWNDNYDRVKEDITLYAKWEDTIYSIEYDLDGGEYSGELQDCYSIIDPIVMPDTSLFTKAGFTFVGLFVDAEYSTLFEAKNYSSDIIVYVKWQFIEYNITYNIPADVTFDQSLNPTKFNLSDGVIINKEPEKVGYTFVSWYLDSIYTQELDTNNPPAQDISIYPYFKEIEFNITYHLNGGVNNISNNDTYKYFDTSIVLHEPNKLGYTFIGWYKDEALTQVFIGENEKKDIDVYAKWDIVTYSINYHLNGGENAAHNPTTYTVENNLYEILDNPTKDGYVFDAWYLDELCTQILENKVYSENINLYANWILSEFLDAASYVVVPNTNSIIVDSSQEKNLAIMFDGDIYVKDVDIQSDNYVKFHDADTNILIIKKSYIDTFKLNVKNEINIEFSDNSIKRYYIAKTENIPYEVVVNAYNKYSTLPFEITFNQVVDQSNVYNVAIDGKNVEYTYSSNSIQIANDVMSTFKMGKHICQIFTNAGITTKSIIFTNEENKYYPKNIKIDLEEFPNIYVRWDIDEQVEYYTATIQGQVYSSQDYPERFTNNSFNAQNLLKLKNDTCVIKAYVGSSVYQSDTATMPYSLYDSRASETYLPGVELIFAKENGTNFAGEENNRYITSWEEFYDAIIAVTTYPTRHEVKSITYTDGVTTKTEDFYCFTYLIDFDISKQRKLDTSGCTTTISLTDRDFMYWLISYTTSKFPEGGSYLPINRKVTDYSFEKTQMYEYCVQVLSVKEPNHNRYTSDNSDVAQSDYTVLHFGSGLSNDYVLPIDRQDQTVEVSTSIELYLALQNGKRVVINPVKTNLVNMYNNMKKILRDILDESMNEFEMALAIYDYLETHVIYDYSLIPIVNEYSSNIEAYTTLFGYSSFYMEGVFNNGVAVCNGIAAAYVSMLNMMGIKAYKIVGTTSTNEAHAWVKLQIGGNWYLCDPTWSNSKITLTTNNKIEVLSYNHFLITEKQSIAQGRTNTKVSPYDDITYCADETIDPYKMMYFTYNGVEYDHYITSREEAEALRDYLIAQFGAAMESGENISINVKCDDVTFLNSCSFSTFAQYSSTRFVTNGTNSYYIVITKR